MKLLDVTIKLLLLGPFPASLCLEYMFRIFVQIEDLLTYKVNYCKETALEANCSKVTDPE
jgi:hypothetical protein